MTDDSPLSEKDLLRWSEALSGLARTGLAFTDSLYERERFEEILAVAADIRTKAESPYDAETLLHEWTKQVGHGVPGYVTPKATVAALVGNERGELLLVQRADSGIWLYPTGWADIGYSPAEVAVKEVLEETGIETEVVRLVGVMDGLRLGFTRIPLYSIVFHLRAVGGRLTPHPLECEDAGFFGEHALPEPIVGVQQWRQLAFAAIRGEDVEPYYDEPRTPPWAGDRQETE
ncbi:MAG: NUDIX hydrolase N-terminal domain-containing protein [Acidimicrobiia bacterium]|nr:NUDIX hydrolase N-terminal domain-containing protein [Acidimicrobiia bacterium]